MSLHFATTRWALQTSADDFKAGRYSREHSWRFDGGAILQASASPHVVRSPFSNPAGIDPEEAFVASLSACHLLWFLSLAAEQGLVVEAYDDDAEGLLALNEVGQLAMTRVTLRPRVRFGARSDQVNSQVVMKLHHDAHAKCFIAASVKALVVVEPGFV